MSITEMIHLESAARHTRSYLSYSFVRQLQSSLVLIQVSKESRRVALARLYLVNASACVSRKFQCCTFYRVLSMCSKVLFPSHKGFLILYEKH